MIDDIQVNYANFGAVFEIKIIIIVNGVLCGRPPGCEPLELASIVCTL